jgi:23S rRNA pseudouridine1911/1915/1917 synthase
MCVAVVRKDPAFVVIRKPAGMPSSPKGNAQAPGEDAARTALDEAAALFPEITGILSGRGRLPGGGGLIHRLDTAAQGLLLFARTQEAYDFFIEEQERGWFIKEYTAFCDVIPETPARIPGFPPAPALPVVESRFRAWGKGGKEVRPVPLDAGGFAAQKAGARVYRTEIRVEHTRARCQISRGFRHQVRCHLAWAGLPVIGDRLYHPLWRGGGGGPDMRFYASGLCFRHPATGVLLRLEDVHMW